MKKEMQYYKLLLFEKSNLFNIIYNSYIINIMELIIFRHLVVLFDKQQAI